MVLTFDETIELEPFFFLALDLALDLWYTIIYLMLLLTTFILKRAKIPKPNCHIGATV